MSHVPDTIENKFLSGVKNVLGSIGILAGVVAFGTFWAGGDAMTACVVSSIIAALCLWGSASITSVWQIDKVNYKAKNKGEIGA